MPLVLGLAALGVLVLGIQIALVEIPWPADPMFGYMNGATVFSGAGGEMYGLPADALRLHHRFLRLGLVGTIAALQALFGYSEFAYYGVGVISVVAVAVLTAVLARRILPLPASLAAGALAVLNPIVLTWSSHPQPDLYMTVWILAGLVLMPRLADTSTSSMIRLASAGAAFGIAWTVKETAPLLFAPVVLTALWVQRARLRQISAFVLGGVAVLTAEGLILWGSTGSPLSRFRVLLTRDYGNTAGSLNARQVARRAALWEQQATVGRSLTIWVSNLANAGRPMLALLAGPLGALYGSFRSRRSWWTVIAVWATWIWLFYGLIGPISAPSGGVTVPLSNLWYWHSLIPAASIGTVGLVYFLGQRLFSGRSASLVSAALAVILIVSLWPASAGDARMITNGQGQYGELRGWLESQGSSKVSGVLRTIRVLGLYDKEIWGGRADARFVHLSEADEDTFLIVDEWTRDEVVDWGGRDIGLNAPPDDMRARFVSSNGEILALQPAGSPVTWASAKRIGEAAAVGAQLEGRESLDFDTPFSNTDSILRVRVEGNILSGQIGIRCTDGNMAAYGGRPGAMRRHREWQFFCPTDGSEQGQSFRVVQLGGRSRIEAVSVGLDPIEANP